MTAGNSEARIQAAKAYSAAHEAAVHEGEGVFLLDANGPLTLAPLGWRGRPLVIRPQSNEPLALAREASAVVGTALEFHSVVQMQGTKWFVLRPR